MRHDVCIYSGFDKYFSMSCCKMRHEEGEINMEIDNELMYVVNIEGAYHKISGKDILLSLDKSNNNLVIMCDKDSKIEDLKKAIELGIK